MMVQSSNQTRFNARIRDLQRLLAALLQEHESLIDVIQGKLLAMRTSDVVVMFDCIQRERQLVERIREHEDMRRALMRQVGGDLGIDTARSGHMTVSELTRHVCREDGVRLQALARQLAHIMSEIIKVNSVVRMFAGEMLSHYRLIYEEIARRISHSGTYSDHGCLPTGVQAQVVDATG